MARNRVRKTYTFDPFTIEGIKELKKLHSPIINSNSAMLEYLVLKEIVNENIGLGHKQMKETIEKANKLRRKWRTSQA